MAGSSSVGSVADALTTNTASLSVTLNVVVDGARVQALAASTSEPRETLANTTAASTTTRAGTGARRNTRGTRAVNSSETRFAVAFTTVTARSVGSIAFTVASDGVSVRAVTSSGGQENLSVSETNENQSDGSGRAHCHANSVSVIEKSDLEGASSTSGKVIAAVRSDSSHVFRHSVVEELRNNRSGDLFVHGFNNIENVVRVRSQGTSASKANVANEIIPVVVISCGAHDSDNWNNVFSHKSGLDLVPAGEVIAGLVRVGLVNKVIDGGSCRNPAFRSSAVYRHRRRGGGSSEALSLKMTDIIGSEQELFFFVFFSKKKKIK